MWLCRCRSTKPWLIAWTIAFASAHATEPPIVGEPIDGNRSISVKVDGSPLAITTTSRLAGAVHSILWNGQEFIDSTDHGRQLQSACSFDSMSDDPFWAERYNPTEAGSRRDGAGDRSTSKLLGIESSDKQIRSSTKMAFWLFPGESSQGRRALNAQPVSNHLLHKRISLGEFTDPHVILVENTFEWPKEENHRYAQFEVLTGYMPYEFSVFWKVSSASGALLKLDDGPGEQADPVILSTRDHRFAMGAIANGHPEWIYSAPGYGRFRFTEEKVVKWNVVFRHRELPLITKQKASFRVLVMVGTLEQVHRAIREALAGKLKMNDCQSHVSRPGIEHSGSP
jgi:hypothetical protein